MHLKDKVGAEKSDIGNYGNFLEGKKNPTQIWYYRNPGGTDNGNQKYTSPNLMNRDLRILTDVNYPPDQVSIVFLWIKFGSAQKNLLLSSTKKWENPLRKIL